jgi:2-keto-4-pentenoate hydratase
VADNASSARVVIGSRLTPVTAVDLRLVGMMFYRNRVPIDIGAGAAALGNPAHCLVWLANKLAGLGSALRAETSSCRALHRMVPVRPADVFRGRVRASRRRDGPVHR